MVEIFRFRKVTGFWYNNPPMEILYTALAIVACILLFSLAVFIHEFGHFLAARKLGMRVDVFSIGFGPAIWKKTINGVEYRISWIPFGGYVALPDLDPEGTKGLEGQSGKDADKAVNAAFDAITAFLNGEEDSYEWDTENRNKWTAPDIVTADTIDDFPWPEW